MSNANQVKERVIQALESDPKSAPYLLRLPPADKDDLYAMLGRISHEICGSAKDDIIEHIDDRETVYMRTLKQAMDKLGEKFEASIASAIEAQGRINSDYSRRITDIEHSQTFTEHQVSYLRESSSNNIELTKQVKALVIALTDRFDQMPKAPQKPPAKKINLAGIPAVGWAVIGVVSIAIISALTGHLGEFFGWLGSVKIFGAVK